MQRVRLTKRQCVCHYLSLPEHTLMNKSSTISNEETRNSVCVFVCVFVCADMCMCVVTSGETGHRMYLSFPVYHPGTSSAPHCHGNLSTHTHPPPAPHTHTHTHIHTNTCAQTHTHTHRLTHTQPYHTIHSPQRVQSAPWELVPRITWDEEQGEASGFVSEFHCVLAPRLWSE